MLIVLAHAPTDLVQVNGRHLVYEILDGFVVDDVRPLVEVGVPEPVSHGRLVFVVVRVGNVVAENAPYGGARAALLSEGGPRALPDDAVFHVPLGEQVDGGEEQWDVHAVLLRQTDHGHLVGHVHDGWVSRQVAEAVLRVELPHRIQYEVEVSPHDDAVELPIHLVITTTTLFTRSYPGKDTAHENLHLIKMLRLKRRTKLSASVICCRRPLRTSCKRRPLPDRFVRKRTKRAADLCYNNGRRRLTGADD